MAAYNADLYCFLMIRLFRCLVNLLPTYMVTAYFPSNKLLSTS